MTLQPRVRVNVLDDDRPLFGDSEMRLLEAIGRQGTLAEGAAALGLSYRAAWSKLHAVEASLGTKLVETTVGGARGGSSRLTQAAERLVGRYNRFRAAVGAFTLAEFVRCFGEEADCNKLGIEGIGMTAIVRAEPLSQLRDEGPMSDAERPILAGEQA